MAFCCFWFAVAKTVFLLYILLPSTNIKVRLGEGALDIQFLIECDAVCLEIEVLRRLRQN